MPGTTQTHASTHALRRLEQRMRRRMRRRTLGHASFRFSIKKNIFLFCLNFFVNWNKKSLYFFTTPPLTPPLPNDQIYIFLVARKINENFVIFKGYPLCFFIEKQQKLTNMKMVHLMLLYRKTAKLTTVPPMLFIEKQQKLANMKRVPPMLFYQKAAKIDKYEKGTPYACLSKTQQQFKKFHICQFQYLSIFAVFR